MSDLNQIHMALERLFSEEGQRIVFWNDPDENILENAADQKHSSQYDSEIKVYHAKFCDLRRSQRQFVEQKTKTEPRISQMTLIVQTFGTQL